ncbi:hypothetical protein SAMN05446935_2931 [Burkholderia sp. YR290]|nr:hypothetical protein SAMN05446935_2931 [Burkholderia sp. YR290]
MATSDPTKSHLAARDALGKRHMLMLPKVTRGDVAAWTASGCIVAAEAFATGVSDWHRPWHGAKPFGIKASEGGDSRIEHAKSRAARCATEAHQSRAWPLPPALMGPSAGGDVAGYKAPRL